MNHAQIYPKKLVSLNRLEDRKLQKILFFYFQIDGAISKYFSIRKCATGIFVYEHQYVTRDPFATIFKYISIILSYLAVQYLNRKKKYKLKSLLKHQTCMKFVKV